QGGQRDPAGFQLLQTLLRRARTLPAGGDRAPRAAGGADPADAVPGAAVPATDPGRADAGRADRGPACAAAGRFPGSGPARRCAGAGAARADAAGAGDTAGGRLNPPRVRRPEAARRADASPPAEASVARTSASTFSGSNAEWPEAGVISSFAFGQAPCRSQAFCSGQTTS